MPDGATDTLTRVRAITAVGIVASLVAPLVLATSFDNPLLFWFVFLLCSAGILVIYPRRWFEPAAIVGAITLWFALNKLVVAMVAASAPVQLTTWLLNFKELLYIALPVVALLYLVSREIRPRDVLVRLRSKAIVADWLALGFLLVLFLAVFISPADVALRLVAVRRFGALPLLYLGGRLLLASDVEFRSALRIILSIALLVAAFGLIERLILGDDFWRDFVHIGSFRDSLVDSGIPGVSRMRGGLPANWTTFIAGHPVRRLVSTFLEPTTLSLFLALCAAFLLLPRPRAALRSHPLRTGVICTALLLTLGKAGFLVLAVAAAVALAAPAREDSRRATALVAAVVALAFGVAWILPLGENLHAHLEGLVGGFGVLFKSPLGAGLGVTGYYGAQTGLASDSSIGTLASQLGIVGLVLWTAWALSVIWWLLPPRADIHANVPLVRQRHVMAGAFAGLLSASVLSTSPGGLLGSALYALLAGWLISSGSAVSIVEHGRHAITRRSPRPSSSQAASRATHRPR